MAKVILAKDVPEKTKQDKLAALITPLSKDSSKLLEVFDTYFKPVCQDIKNFLEVDEFKGGFDEMQLLNKYILSLDYSTAEGKQKTAEAHTLAIRWEAADALCNYEASKLRLDPGEWWKMCWNKDDED